MAAQDMRNPWWQPMPLIGADVQHEVAYVSAHEGIRVAQPVHDALRAAAAKLSEAGYMVEEVAPPPLREARDLQLHL